MKFSFLAVALWSVCGMLVTCLSNSYFPEGTYRFERNSHVTYNYDRMGEVQKQCVSVLSASSELRSEYSGVTGMKGELSFINGDWKQDAGKFPIMPFDAGKSPGTSSEDHIPLKLVSFWVTDVDHARRLKKSVPVNGFMVMGITQDGTFGDNAYNGNPDFQLWPGHSQLSIPFQGIYTESKKNGGERVLCLLGNTMLPTREADPANPWDWMKTPGEVPLSEDDQILLVLRYPMRFTLTNRMIRGELKSLNRQSNLKYFDVVHMSSQLGKSAKYMFGSQYIVSKACNPYPYKDNMTNVGGIGVYKGSRFCEILEEITREQPLYFVPNWRCNGTDDFCSKLGPFLSDKEIKSTDGGFQDVKLYMQDVICEQAATNANTGSARVSTVFRAFSPSENQYTAAKRSGPNNMSLAAEGIWKSSSGQLCMVGCLGSVDAKGSSCNTRICLYIPTTFSIKQRSIILGTLSPINNSSAFFPLSFEQLVQPTELWNYFKFTHPNYSYSKTNLAGTVLEKNEPFSFSTVVKKSLLTFPKLEDNEAFQNSLSLLSEDLTFHVSGLPDPVPKVPAPGVDIQMDILSVGPLFGRFWYARNGSTWEQETPYHAKPEYTEKQLLINVSAQLSLTGKSFGNFSVLFLEGLYDPHVGKMYLIGCRDVRASWKVLYQSGDLEAGLDCLIEVVVTYPPTTTRWLVNPTAEISIESQRTEDDPLQFNTTKLQTFPIIYRKQREDVLSQRGVEGILRILMLSFAVGCILSQLFYIKQNVDSLPYISLVVLAVQALGYSIPLVTGAEALFKRITSESYDLPSGELENSEWLHVIDYTVKMLLIVSLLLTLRLLQKVWKSRIRLLTRSPLGSLCVPSEKWVFLCTVTVHLIGYVIVLIIHGLKTSQKPLRAKTYLVDGEHSHSLPEWATELEEYVGLVEDFFLFPQIIGNLIWQIDCKPLGKLYFIGITMVRLLPHIYDYIQAPVPNPYISEDSEFVNRSLDFFSKFGDIAIPVTAIILAFIVYIQQRWSYEKLSQVLTFGQHKLLLSFRYERLPSKSSETELVAGINGGAANEKEQFDVDTSELLAEAVVNIHEK